MVWASEITKHEWVCEDDGRVLIFCPGCWDAQPAEYLSESKTFRLECLQCDAVYEIDEDKVDFYQPI